MGSKSSLQHSSGRGSRPEEWCVCVEDVFLANKTVCFFGVIGLVILVGVIFYVFSVFGGYIVQVLVGKKQTFVSCNIHLFEDAGCSDCQKRLPQ